MKTVNLLSVVIPVFNSSKFLAELVQRLSHSISNFANDYELVLVDDGSTDDSWLLIQSFSSISGKIKGLKFSKNQGQHQAILAGLRATKGEWVVVMDADLQDPPEQIENLVKAALKDQAEVAVAIDESRGTQNRFSFWSKTFYKILNLASGLQSPPGVGNFGCYSRRLVDQIKNVEDLVVYFPALIAQAGYKNTKVGLPRGEKNDGYTTYNFVKRVRLARQTLIWNSNKLLRISIALGLAVSTAGILYALIVAINFFAFGAEIEGWSSLAILISLMGGLNLMSSGILGIYIGHIFDSIRKKPQFVITDVCGLDH